jgi:hypothetical protein
VKIDLIEDTPYGADYLARDMEVQVIPRIGETFSWDYNLYKITQVTHLFDRGRIRVLGRRY